MKGMKCETKVTVTAGTVRRSGLRAKAMSRSTLRYICLRFESFYRLKQYPSHGIDPQGEWKDLFGTISRQILAQLH
jgi:hypothetical protein